MVSRHSCAGRSAYCASLAATLLHGMPEGPHLLSCSTWVEVLSHLNWCYPMRQQPPLLLLLPKHRMEQQATVKNRD